MINLEELEEKLPILLRSKTLSPDELSLVRSMIKTTSVQDIEKNLINITMGVFFVDCSITFDEQIEISSNIIKKVKRTKFE